jgi:hypothetical protein
MLSRFWDITLAAFLVLWLIVSILCQRRNSRVLRTRFYDFASLIPSYRFFVPRPIEFDYELLYRAGYVDRAVSDWIVLRPPDLGAMCFLWNPQQRVRKAVCDLVTLLLRDLRTYSRGNIQLSYSYLVLLNRATPFARSSRATIVQFAIARNGGFENDQRKTLFISRGHLTWRSNAHDRLGDTA